MPIFKVLGINLEDGGRRVFHVDNQTLKISKEAFKPSPVAPVRDLAQQAKDGPFSRVKIQLGLNCNFSCSYCGQKSAARTETFRVEDIPAFIERFEMLPVEQGTKVELWGGEPLVYWKVLKPLVEALRAIRPDLRFSTVTNGSLLTKEKLLWMFNRNFSFGLSHDGPGQAERGEDPLETNREAIEYAINLFAPKGRFSFNAVLNNKNQSRKAIIDWFEAKFPGKKLGFGELDLITAYDPEGVEVSKMDDAQTYALRRGLWSEVRANPILGQKCQTVGQTVGLVASANQSNDFVVMNSKCDMEMPNSIALDLTGRVLTCQNVSALDTAPNGASHQIGTVEELDKVRMTSAIHWSQREKCPTCPVLKLCRGSCMFLSGEHFDVSCDSAYSEAIVNFALGFETVTGYVPAYIEQEGLPETRANVFGPDDLPAPKPKRVIPIKAVPA